MSELEKENKLLKLEIEKLRFLLNKQIMFAEEKRNEAELDFLTKVYNRLNFTKFLEEFISNNKIFSVIFIDLDNFKQINDKYSHKSGDDVLIEVASVLLGNSRNNSIVGRLGGEEFAIIVPDVKEDICFSIAERLRKDIEDIEFLENEKIKVTASLGIYTPKKNDHIEKIIHRADQAMYFSKKNGKNKTTKYSQLKK